MWIRRLISGKYLKFINLIVTDFWHVFCKQKLNEKVFTRSD